MNRKPRIKKQTKKWRENRSPIVDTDLNELNAELLGIEMCRACEHTFPRDHPKCPNCGETSPLYG